MMTDLRTSLLVNRQVPEFVREDHPKFLLFLEAYYEFLDANGYGKSKQLKYISDVDVSMEEFEQHFYNTFLPFLPRDSAVSKETLIKNILPLYLSKGSEKSYRFLFRLLFNEEIELQTPGKQILKASDGKWSQQNVIRVDTNIYSEYICDGINFEFNLPYEMDQSQILVFYQNAQIYDYEFRKEYKKIRLNFVPDSGNVLRIQYKDFRGSILNNLRIVGKSSGTPAIIEFASRTNVNGVNFYQLFIDNKKIIDNFTRSEILETNYIVEGKKIPLSMTIYSGLLRVEIVDGGSSYNIGDTVIVRGPSEIPALVVVDDVVSATIDGLNVITGGAGYKIGNEIIAEGFDISFFDSVVLTVDNSGLDSSNTLTINTDIINDYANIQLDSLDFGFPVDGAETIDSVISEVLTNQTITGLGPITSTIVNSSQLSTSVIPNIITQSSTVVGNLRISDFGCIGKIDILDGGEGYEVGDMLIFTNVDSFSGQGANAVVSVVDDFGSITAITINNPGLSYQLEYLPQITVNSVNGIGAVLVVSKIMGFGATYSPIIGEGISGQIKSIKVISEGVGYEIVPGIDLSLSGDGNAKGIAVLTESTLKLPGKWKNSDGILSDDQIRLQGRDYYIPYSYVISSRVEFNKYKNILKNLLHPSGLINYSKYTIRSTAEVNILNDVESYLSLYEIPSYLLTENGNVLNTESEEKILIE
jgi:hypothetical protein